MFALSQLFVEWAGGRVMWGRAASSWPGQPGKLPPSRVLLSFALSHRWQTHPGEHRSSSESFKKSASSFFHGIIHSASLGSFSLWMKQWPIPICSSRQIAIMRTKTVVRPLAVLQVFRLHDCRFSSVMPNHGNTATYTILPLTLSQLWGRENSAVYQVLGS
jgi:hypothetical protein